MNKEELKNFKQMQKYVNKIYEKDLELALKESELSIENIHNGDYKISFDCKTFDTIYRMVYHKRKMLMTCNCVHGSTVGINNKVPKNNKTLCRHKMYAFANLDKELRKLK